MSSATRPALIEIELIGPAIPSGGLVTPSDWALLGRFQEAIREYVDSRELGERTYFAAPLDWAVGRFAFEIRVDADTLLEAEDAVKASVLADLQNCSPRPALADTMLWGYGTRGSTVTSMRIGGLSGMGFTVDERYRRELRQRSSRTYERGKAISGELIRVGGMNPRLHVMTNGGIRVMRTTKEVAVKARASLYEAVRLHVWERVDPVDGTVMSTRCDTWIDAPGPWLDDVLIESAPGDWPFTFAGEFGGVD